MVDINMSDILMEEAGEPYLNYWKPVPKTVQVVSPIMPSYMMSHPINIGWAHPTATSVQYNHTAPAPMTFGYPQQTPYPITDVVNSYIKNQQIGLSRESIAFEGERRRLSQYSQVNTEHLLYTLSSNPGIEQNSQLTTDSLIQDEVTRAAKTLFSKRNRTLLHWLNPDVNKSQIKIDVNAAWDSLPTTEKVFYISQVLGKFAPQTTSLMVNPQLEPTNIERGSVENMMAYKNVNDFPFNKSNELKRRTVNTRMKGKPKTQQRMPKLEKNPETVKTEVLIEDDRNFDSDLVINEGADEPEGKPRGDKSESESPEGTKPRVKRKYTKRKKKETSTRDINEGNDDSSSCPLLTDIKITKQEGGTPPVHILGETIPRVKRKYVKRKLVRKKYKKREPKTKSSSGAEMSERGHFVKIEPKPEPLSCEEDTPVPEAKEVDEGEDMDVFIDIDENSILTNEEVDKFWESIEDPNNLFLELGIMDNECY